MRYEDIREGLGITDKNILIKCYKKKWLEHGERMPQNLTSELLYLYKPNGRRCQRCATKDVTYLISATGTDRKLTP
jgi:hypothetical protein